MSISFRKCQVLVVEKPILRLERSRLQWKFRSADVSFTEKGERSTIACMTNINV